METNVKDYDGRITRESAEARILELSVQTAETHAETAKLTYKKITESLSMRVTTIAGIAGNLLAHKAVMIDNISGAVGIAKQIIAAAEAADTAKS